MRNFSHFHDGVKIGDFQINDFIRDCLQKITEGEPRWCISTGDTSVAAFKWTTEIEVLVATSDGRSRIRFPIGEPLEFEPYTRPTRIGP